MAAARSRSVMDELTLRGDLLNKVEFVPVRGQHRDAGLCCGQEDQRVVEAFLALMWQKPLRTRERPRDYACVRPDLCVRCQQSA